MAFTAVPSVALAPGAAPAAQICVPPPGLSGHWRGNDQGDYYIREIGNTVYWVGLDSTTNGAGWTHMFTGYRSGATINGRWADVRGNTGAGTLSLTMQGNRLIRTASTGSGFGGSRWIKRC
ncbi:MAG TPA: hypothetical protein VKC17_11805 [Sphingomicrobium sp.]|nr:hypothetical protein [Sphingomicrobium sp.]